MNPSTTSPSIRVSPNPSKFDENISIEIHGLEGGKSFTLHSQSIEHRNGDVFECIAHYNADEMGIIDLAKHPAVGGGFYEGIEPMGLLWALKPSSKNRTTRLSTRTKNKRMYGRPVRNEAAKPMEITIKVFENFVDAAKINESRQQFVAEVQVIRQLMTEADRQAMAITRKNSLKDIRFFPPINEQFSKANALTRPAPTVQTMATRF